MSHARQPIFIVSTGRTGTKFLAQYFAHHHNDVEAHHTTPFSTLINGLSNLNLAGLLSDSMLLRSWRLLKGRHYGVTDKSFFIDSNNHLYGFARLAGQLYPECKFIHVVRDPRSYVRSHLNWSYQRPKSYLANHVLPFWQPSPMFTGEFSWSVHGRLSRFEKFCWIWRFKNRLMSQLDSSRRNYLCIAFEDFTNPLTTHRCLDRMARFIGLPDHSTQLRSTAEQAVNTTTTSRVDHWSRWSSWQCARLHQLCQPEMSKYGYGTELLWQQKVDVGAPHYGLSGD